MVVRPGSGNDDALNANANSKGLRLTGRQTHEKVENWPSSKETLNMNSSTNQDYIETCGLVMSKKPMTCSNVGMKEEESLFPIWSLKEKKKVVPNYFFY